MVSQLSERARILRSERLIAGSRIALAVVALAAFGIDPTEPPQYAWEVFLLVGVYLGIALGVAVAVWSASRPLPRLALAAHVFDLGMFGSVIFFTRGPSSPFFVFFVFALVAAALRWQWAGTLWTGGAALATLLGSGLLSALSRAGPELELNRFIIRCGYLVVIAILLGYLGNHEKRLREEVSRGAAMAERLRLAHDLHDGVIQSLTGATLSLGTLPALIGRDPAAARETVGRVEELLFEEQRGLRTFMEEVREVVREAPERPFEERLEEVIRGVERHWDLDVEREHDLGGASLPPRLANEVCWLLREALVNAARHGEASNVRVAIEAADGSLRIRVADEGCGFPFQGRYDWGELREQNRGPRSLKHRIAALGGTLALESSDDGAILEMELPLPARQT